MGPIYSVFLFFSPQKGRDLVGNPTQQFFLGGGPLTKGKRRKKFTQRIFLIDFAQIQLVVMDFFLEDYVNYVNMLKILKEEFVKHPGSWKKRMFFFSML